MRDDQFADNAFVFVFALRACVWAGDGNNFREKNA